MSIYHPTWLYVKQHRVTGLKYFGKTTRDPYHYRGSGVYWKKHIMIHGNEVDTIWAKRFDTEYELKDYARKFSADNRIVESNEWANLIPENGLDGGAHGHITSNETKQKISKSLMGKPSPKKHTENYSDGAKKGWALSREKRVGENHHMAGKPQSIESRLKNSISNKNRPKIECPHCGVSCHKGAYNRWHGDNCKKKYS